MYIFIGDLAVSVNEGWTILQACMVIGIDLPRFCYHERLSIAGNCRMCLVETNLSKKLVIACATLVVDNMVVSISSLRVRKARESILEFLLSNHPLDCPICDQGGECDLQDLTFLYGSDRGRFYELSKRSVSNKYFGTFIKTYMVRCIHCTRCIRFLWEVCGFFNIGAIGRGVFMEISNYIESWLEHELSGNIIDLCPVGALTSKAFSFIGRSWEIFSVESFDFLDGFCSGIRFDLIGQKVVRVLPAVNNVLNEEWITNKIRFFYDSLYLQRLLFPMMSIRFFFFFLIGVCLISWEFSFKLLSFLLTTEVKELVLVFGGLYSLWGIYKFKDLFLRIGCRFFSYCNVDFRWFFLRVFTDWFFIGYSFFFLISNNIRVESPLFTSRLRCVMGLRKVVVFFLGLGLEVLTFLVINIGNSFSLLLKVVECLYVRFFFLMKMFLVFGTSFFHRSDISKFYYLIYYLYSTGIFYLYIHYTFVFLHFFEFSFPVISVFGGWNVSKKGRLIYLVGMDELRDIDMLRESLVVYQGAYGEVGALFAFLILPVRTVFEITGLFLNTLGMILQARESLSILNNILRDDEVFLMLIGSLDVKIYPYKFFSLFNLVFLAFYLFSGLSVFKDIVCIFVGIIFVCYYNSLFFSSVIDFYRNYIYCRVSRLLLDCSRKVNEKRIYM